MLYENYTPPKREFSSAFRGLDQIYVHAFYKGWEPFVVKNTDDDTAILEKIERNTTLDSGQRQSLLKFFFDPLVLIQGPPGTGKSFIGCLMTEIIYNNTNAKIMLMT